PLAARANAMKKQVPTSAAIANESSVTHAGANAPPPIPASAAAVRLARVVAPIDRAATYVAAGTSAAAATTAACADRNGPSRGSSVTIPAACSTDASGIQKRWLGTGSGPKPGASRKVHTKSAVRP